jgi:hypothetical protein
VNEVVSVILAVLSIIALFAGVMSFVLSFIRLGDRELRGRKFTFILVGTGLLLWIIAAVSYWLSTVLETGPAPA